MQGGPWSRVEGIQECETVTEAIDKVIAKCHKDGDFPYFDRIFTHIMVMFMDDEAELEVAGTFVIDFALHGVLKGAGIASMFKAFLHIVAGF